MSTALIGKEASVAWKARVAVVSPIGDAALASLAARTGHEVIECSDWAALDALLREQAIDLVLFREDVALELPASLPVPALLLSDRPAKVPGATGSIDPSRLQSVIEPLFAIVAELGHASARCRELNRIVQGIRAGAAMVGNTPVMRRLQSAISRAADADVAVLVEGPKGSGKSLVARMIHCKSRRGARPLEVLDCGAANGEELTKALHSDGGTTLILEDVDRLVPAAQAVLVRNLKERTSARSNTAPRLVATTSAHLPEMVARGSFREDLYYRLHTMPITVPALRERVEDILLIAESVLAATASNAGRPVQGITDSARSLLTNTQWPGNVAQLEAALQRAQLAAGGAPIDRAHLLAPTAPVAPATLSTPKMTGDNAEVEVGEAAIRPFEQEEQDLLSRALRATKGNVRRAAQLLGIGRATLYRKIQQYQLRLQ